MKGLHYKDAIRAIQLLNRAYQVGHCLENPANIQMIALPLMRHYSKTGMMCKHLPESSWSWILKGNKPC